MAFNFGGSTTSTPSLFGGTATSTASTGFGGFGGLGTGTTGGGFGFGGQTATTQGTTGFSFGQPAASTAGTGLSFGLPGATTTAPTGFGFGAPAASTGSFGFGTGTTSSAPSFGATSGFGGLGSTSTGFGGFGTSAGFGGTGSTFGAAKPTSFGFGQPQAATQQPQQQQQQQQQNALANLAMAVSMPQIFGDERDAIIASWNQLQACWGTGKGFSQSGVVDFKPDNPFCRFKAVGYTAIPTGRNEDGLVALVLKKKQEEVTAAQTQVVDTITKILGKPNLSVCVEGVRPVPEDRTEIVIYVIERPPQGPAKRIAAKELCAFLQQQMQWHQLSVQLAAESMAPRMGWSAEQIKQYLDTPPAGIDPLLWRQAKLDNPDSGKLVPVAMVGFRELQRRLKHQEEETRLHQQRLDVIAGDLGQLQTQHSQTLAKLDDYKRKHLELGHRLLKVVVKQEICRKLGYAVQVEEEMLKVQLEHLQVELNHPTQFKGRLNELMSQIRMQSQAGFGRDEPTYQMDTNMQAEIKLILKQQQEGLQHLIDVIKDDSKDLNRMEQALDTSTITR
ncbi:nucleoporin p54-like [Littorina saxatilis]|uniref:Uncharacterized protein n=1 Tax=Littorina saxatilis TaxID=31220 RepID=A0AAN9B3B5_9CAEN